ncbi:MAG: biopolymer transporter ExbD, partial [Prevotella sp.]
MSIFTRHDRRLNAELNTASLPDLIFTVLFF